MRLFIAEKPSMARALAEALGNGIKRNGYIECGDTNITWCFGHLLEQYNPEDYTIEWRAWRRDTLPMVPNVWKLKPRPDVLAQLETIGRLLQTAAQVIHAGDPDREGQLLVDEVLEHFTYTKGVQRIWLSSLDRRSIDKALSALTDNVIHAPLRDAARARAQADWLVGLNATRAMTLLGRMAGRQERVLSLGRVQTPTLALVVARDRAIAAFKPIDYFVLQAPLEHQAGTFTAQFQPTDTQTGLDSEGRLIDAKVAAQVAESVRGKTGNVLEVIREKKKKAVPLPHCLSSLQKAASAKLNLSAQDVLNIAQALYEKKLTTYPRTDCRYLPEEQYVDSKRILQSIQRVGELTSLVEQADFALRGPVWNSKKITAHHAIIPTGEVPRGLSAVEHKLYVMITSAFCLQFYLPMVYEAQKIRVTLEETLWEAKGRLIVQAGWTTAGQEEEEDEKEPQGTAAQALPNVRQGDAVLCTDVEQQAKKTSPPPRFTEGTLIEAMANVHRFVDNAEAKTTLKENEGIGTEATRAGMLETLKARGYLQKDKKALVSTELGRDIIDLTPETLKDPVTTAQWERRLSAIAAGKDSLANFMKEHIQRLPHLLAPVLQAKPALSKTSFACPSCGRALRQLTGSNGLFWGCTAYPECRATFPDDDGKPGQRKPQGDLALAKIPPCPECGGTLVYFKNKKGYMTFACFAKMKHANENIHFWNDNNGQPRF